MSTFVVSIFPTESKAYEAVHAMNELHREGSISLYDTTVAQRKEKGLEIKKEGFDVVARTGLGALIGALVGVFGGPAGMAVGALAGTGLGATHGIVRSDVSDEFLEDISKKMKVGDYAVLAEVSETWTAPIDTRIQALGGTVLREKRSDYTDALVEKSAEGLKAEIDERKTKRAAHKAERMEGKLEDSIADARERLQRVATRAHDKLDSTKAELQAKLDALETQANKATPEVKQAIQQHIADLRKDFSERERKLTRAFELAEQALQA